MKEVKQPDRKRILYFYSIAIALLLIGNLLLPSLIAPRTQNVSYNEFVDMAEQGKIAQAEIQSKDNRIVFTVKNENQKREQVYVTALVDDPKLVDRLLNSSVDFTKIWPTAPSPFLTAVLPFVMIIGFGMWMTRSMQKKVGSGMMSFGKSNAKVYVASETGIHFADVQGEDEAKELLTEIVDFLHNPQRYADIGAHIPKGALLVGHSGHGQNPACKSSSRRGKCPILLHFRL